jgi:hypothetical protein
MHESSFHYEQIMHECSYTAGNWNLLHICMLSHKYMGSDTLMWGPPKKLPTNIFLLGCPPLQQCVSFPTWASQRCNEHFLWPQGIWPVFYISGHGYSSGPCWWTPCGFLLVCGDKCLVASTVHLNTSLQKWHWAHASSNSSGLRLYASKTFISCSTSSYMSVHVTLRTAFCPILNKLTLGLWSSRTANFCHAVYILYFF